MEIEAWWRTGEQLRLLPTYGGVVEVVTGTMSAPTAGRSCSGGGGGCDAQPKAIGSRRRLTARYPFHLHPPSHNQEHSKLHIHSVVVLGSSGMGAFEVVASHMILRLIYGL